MKTYGPSNDEPSNVHEEIRAAEIDAELDKLIAENDRQAEAFRRDDAPLIDGLYTSAQIAEGVAAEDALRDPEVTARNAAVFEARRAAEPDCRDENGEP